MKQKILLFTLSLGLGYLALSSYNTGAAANAQGDRTGRLSLTCAASGCHAASGGATTCTIEVRKKSAGMSSAVVTQYIQDTMYTVTLKGTNSTLSKFGFQLCAATGTANAGTFSNLPTSTKTSTASGFSLLEQSTAINKNAAGNDSVTFDWKAPGNSSVTFYGILNAVNGNGNESGDAVSAPATATLQNAASVGGLDNNISFTISPNPFSSYLKLKMENAAVGTYAINAYDLHGRKLIADEIKLSSASGEAILNTANWSQGVYFVQVINGEIQKTIRVIK